MRITYFALKDVQIGDEVRVPGDLIPEAASWSFLPGYIRDGYVAPVLVATLPQDVQDVLVEWEMDQLGPRDVPVPDSEGKAKSAKPKEKVS
jgi:hypothetical protein